MVSALEGSDPLSAPVTPEDAVLLGYALKLTEKPSCITSEDVSSLRKAGFSDRAIHDACQIVAYFAYVNRVADGLGVELENET